MSTGRRGFVIIAVSIVAGLAAAGAALWYEERTFVPPILPDDPRQVALGAAIYAARCAQCHGANLEGQPNWQQRKPNGRLPAPPHDASGHSWHHPDVALFDITKNGMTPYAPAGYESDMPSFGNVLTDEQIAATIAFIESRWPASIRAQHARIDEQASDRDLTP